MAGGKHIDLGNFAHAQAAALAVAKFREDPQGHLAMLAKIRCGVSSKPCASKVKKAEKKTPKDKAGEKKQPKDKTIKKKKQPKKKTTTTEKKTKE